MEPNQSRSIETLKANPKNPRTISKHDFAALKKAMKEFGDLGGVVFNRQTNQLVGGHMRTESFRELQGTKDVMITQQFETPLRSGTVAIGYIRFDGELFAYREVDWDPARQAAATIAPNRIQGEWQLDMLAEFNHDISQFDNGAELLELTGQTEQELERLNAGPDTGEEKPDDGLVRLSLKLTQEQSEAIYAAVDRVKSQVRLNNEGNGDNDANAIYYICRDYLDRGLDDQSQSQGMEAPQEPAA